MARKLAAEKRAQALADAKALEIIKIAEAAAAKIAEDLRIKEEAAAKAAE